jgi:hypothetical protein
MGRYTQVFTLDLGVPPDQAWPALLAAVDNMDGAKLGERDETTHHLSFSTGVTVSSWGQELDATLTPAAPAGSRVAVRAKPKGTFLTTTWGERIHARTVEKRLRAELTSALG